MSREVINAKGQVCPKPVIVTLNKLKQMDEGDVLEIHVTDKLVRKHLPDRLKQMDFEVDIEETDDGWKIITKK